MRTTLFALSLAFCLVAPAFAVDAAPAQAASPTPSAGAAVKNSAPNDSLPFFGGVKKTPAQQERDRQVVAEAIRRAGSQQKAEAVALRDGWAKIKSGDSVTAIKYFNLAWLIDPRNPDVLWGFGSALGQQGRFAPALRLFEIARGLIPHNGDLLSDYAYVWIGKGATRDSGVDAREASFAKALELLDAAEKINSTNPRIYSNRAMIRFYEARYSEAWAEVDKAESLVPGSVDPRFLHDLSARMPHPKK